MEPEAMYVTDRDSGIALVTGQIIEAWVSRLPRTRGNVTPKEMAEMVLAVRTSLGQAIPGQEHAEGKGRPSAPVTNLRPVS